MTRRWPGNGSMTWEYQWFSAPISTDARLSAAFAQFRILLGAMSFGNATVTVTAFKIYPVRFRILFGDDRPAGNPDHGSQVSPSDAHRVGAGGVRTNIGTGSGRRRARRRGVHHPCRRGHDHRQRREYVIDSGPKHHGDFTGPFKVTIISTRKAG